MKILSLELFNYNRMMLNNIQHFKIATTEQLQLILGTNGSGKSSLMEELTPLPANSSDYHKDGFKTIVIEHRSSFFLLKSSFSGSQKHNFLKDGEELNPGGTLSVQKDLVKKEFGITPEIHELLIGQKKFHQMGPMERRQWFTALADSDYDYAIITYMKLKKRLRDTIGALEVSQRHLVTETAKLMTKEEYNVLKKQVEELYIFLQNLQDKRIPIDQDLNSLKADYLSINHNLKTNVAKLIQKKKSLKRPFSFESEEEIVSLIEDLNAKVSVERLLLSKSIEDFNLVNNNIEILKLTDNNSVQQLTAQLIEINNEIESLNNKKKLKLNIQNADNASNALDTVYDTISTVFATLPANVNRKFTKQKLLDTDLKIKNLAGEISKVTSDLNKTLLTKEHQEHKRDGEKIDCPNCNHRWAVGYNEALYNNICVKVELLQSNLDELTTVFLENQSYKKEIEEYSVIYREYSNCVKNWPALNPFWDYINNTADIFESPKKVLGFLELFKFDLTISKSLDNKNNRLTELNNLIKLAKDIDVKNTEDLISKRNILEEIITNHTQAVKKHLDTIAAVRTYKQDLEILKDISAKLESDVVGYENYLNKSVETYKRTAITDSIKVVQLALSKKEQLLSEVNIQQAIIKDLESKIELLKVDADAFRILVKELSPTDGLIAKGLMGFIKSFVSQMNLFIKKIWAYPLKVQPCGIADGGMVELDYKFPLLVQTDANKRNDVSKGSTAMKEVIDLAFRIVAMKYLGLSDFPLYLDEFAASMDSSHRTSALETIRIIMDTQSFTQLFMISHYSAAYGSLSNAEICVLCQNNIVVPQGSVFNRHVTLS